MPAPKHLSGYGDLYLQLLEAINLLTIERPSFQLTFPSEGQAVHIRQRFYAFRQVLRREAQQLYSPNLQQTTVTTTGTSLIFTLGDRSTASVLQQLKSQGLFNNRPLVNPPPATSPAIPAARGGPQALPQAEEPSPQEEEPSVQSAQQKFEDQLASMGFTSLRKEKQ